jgi:serine/threonine-protein kinase RsbT
MTQDLSEGQRHVASAIDVAINSSLDILAARQKGRALAQELGFSAGEATLFAAAISELGRDILHFAHRGQIRVEPLRQEGPGFMLTAAYSAGSILSTPNIVASSESISNWSSRVREHLRHLMDEMEFSFSWSGASGAITAIKWLR